MRHHAVSVIGGGVAGAAACLALAQRGHSPLWLAPPETRGREPVGESLSPAATPILAQLGLAAIIQSSRHRSARATFSSWGSDMLVERNAFLHLEGPGHVIDRRFFEEQMRDAASAVAESCHCGLARGTARPEGGWLLALANGSEVTTDFVIDASGRAAVVGRSRAALERTDRLVAATAFLPHRDASVEPTRATLIEAVCDGWWYAALLPDGRLALAWFSDPDLTPPGLSRDIDLWRERIAGSVHIARWIADAGFAVEAPPRLVSAGTARLANAGAAGDEASGWAAAGDAAAAFDPLSSHGLTTALWSGVQAGQAAAGWLAGDRDPLAVYAGRVAAGYARFLEQRAAIYACEQRFSRYPFWQRRHRSDESQHRFAPAPASAPATP